MHQAVGRQPFETCAIFPYAFAHTPGGGIAVALSPVCPSARLGLGVAPLEAEDDLRDRLAQAEPRKTEVYRLRPDRAIAWENFRDIEKALLACLSADELPMRRRLYLGTRYWARCSTMIPSTPLNGSPKRQRRSRRSCARPFAACSRRLSTGIATCCGHCRKHCRRARRSRS